MHATTNEMVQAARRLTHGRAEVYVHLARIRRTDSSQPIPDEIFIRLPPRQDGRRDQAMLVALLNRLDAIAHAHNLVRTARSAPSGVFRFDYRRASHVIQTVLVVTRSAAASPSSTAKLAVIVDDLGNTPGAVGQLRELHVPLTVAVLPNLRYSTEAAETAHRLGFQVLLHLPMQPMGAAPAEAVELKPGMNSAQVSRMVAAMLRTVPFAVGVDNHEGSRATADVDLMAELMSTLARHGLFFVDSRTTPATVAYNEAVSAGIPAASRNVFLDDTATPAAVRAQLALAIRDARRDGTAIAIGHPHPATLAVLAWQLPLLAPQGITLVYASDLCGLRESPTRVGLSAGSPPPEKPRAAQLPALR